MYRCIIFFFSFNLLLFANLIAQNQCIYKPKNFPSAFRQYSFDYYGFSNQPITIQKKTSQLESIIIAKNIIKEDYNETSEEIISIALLRIGLGDNLEIRTYINNTLFVQTNHIFFGGALKYNLTEKLNSKLRLGVLLEYSHFNSENYTCISTLSKIYLHNAVSLNYDIGVRLHSKNNLNYSYGFKCQLKPQKSKTGIFVLTSNKYILLNKTILFGILITNNKSFDITFSYGLSEVKSLFTFGLAYNFK